MAQSVEEIKKQYYVEQQLAERLRYANRSERIKLYSEVYDEFFAQFPNHIQFKVKYDTKWSEKYVAEQVGLLKKFLHNDAVFAEIGAGDCRLSMALCKWVKHVYAIDVSKTIAATAGQPVNFELKISNGITLPLASVSIHIVYSNQLMEHLHPDDAVEQLEEIYRVLTPGGKYICITPNRLIGPHDISCYFDKVAAGFHLREYSFGELKSLLIQTGFSKITGYVGAKGKYLLMPVFLLHIFEWAVGLLPRRLRRNNLFRILLNVKVIAEKG